MTVDAWIRFWTAVWVGWIALSGRAIDLVLCTTPAKPPASSKKAPSEAEQPAEDAEETGEDAKKPAPEKPEKRRTTPTKGSPALRIFCLVLAAGFIYGLPWTTRIAVVAAVAWTATAIALGFIATRTPKEKQPEKGESNGEEQPGNEPPEPEQHPSELLPLGHVAVLLSEAYTEGSGVHLATLAERLTRTPLMGLPATPWKTAHVRALLTRHGVRVRPGVRVPPVGGREGVHREDFPPLPPTPSESPVVGVVVAGQSNNNIDGNTASYPFQVVDDPANPARAHVHHTGR
ncbi:MULTISPECIES: hypothetical protein [unclassified Streptomyces]|uniref:hypothetical protein n=1 Tax=unclassified Streptomyces TaxID=2593676 RepID=UPI00117F6B1C|nr:MULTISPECIES: hypothetical protein [unclassified Streptomyces]